MKRIKAACICQTLHFMLKEEVSHDFAVRQVKEEVVLLLRRLFSSFLLPKPSFCARKGRFSQSPVACAANR